MERFLRYSLERGRAIRLIWMEEGRLCQGNVQVTSLSEDKVCLTCLRPKKNLTLPPEDILSADYRKGDGGEEG